jgi:hypothetical protein
MKPGDLRQFKKTHAAKAHGVSGMTFVVTSIDHHSFIDDQPFIGDSTVDFIVDDSHRRGWGFVLVREISYPLV